MEKHKWINMVLVKTQGPQSARCDGGLQAVADKERHQSELIVFFRAFKWKTPKAVSQIANMLGITLVVFLHSKISYYHQNKTKQNPS